VIELSADLGEGSPGEDDLWPLLDAANVACGGHTGDGASMDHAALMARKDLFVRNFTSKMLGYALGRGLTLQDSCTVDRIVAELRENDYRAQKLIELIVLSVPFQYQPPVARRPKEARP